MIIQHNMTSANTNRQLGITNANLQSSSEKLSSGYQVNRAADDAAGLSISEKMRGQIRGLERASSNAQDGISLIQTAEGALNEIHSIVQRMRELVVQAANDTNVTEDRLAIADELTALISEIDRIASQTEYNTMRLLNGTFASVGKAGHTGKNGTVRRTLQLQVGANASQLIKVNIATMSSKGLGINKIACAVAKLAKGTTAAFALGKNKDVSGSYGKGITKLLTIMDKALKDVSTQRSKLGSIQNRLDHTILNADNTAENLQSAESRIRDVDMAKEMVKYSKDSILQQAAQSMLAQANQSTQGVLSLLR